MIDPNVLQAVTTMVQRPHGLFVRHILDNEHELTAARHSNNPPYYPVTKGVEL